MVPTVSPPGAHAPQGRKPRLSLLSVQNFLTGFSTKTAERIRTGSNSSEADHYHSYYKWYYTLQSSKALAEKIRQGEGGKTRLLAILFKVKPEARCRGRGGLRWWYKNRHFLINFDSSRLACNKIRSPFLFRLFFKQRMSWVTLSVKACCRLFLLLNWSFYWSRWWWWWSNDQI